MKLVNSLLWKKFTELKKGEAKQMKAIVDDLIKWWGAIALVLIVLKIYGIL